MALKISETEKRALAALVLNAESSNKEVAQFAGIREHVVRRVRSKYLASGIIEPVYQINVYQLGWTDFGIFLSQGGTHSSNRAKFERALSSEPQVLWVGKLGGDFDYGISFLAKKNHELDDFFSRIRPASNAGFFHKTVALKFDWSIYIPKYLARDVGGIQAITISSRGPVLEVDDVDHRILGELANNPRATPSTLARLMRMPITTLNYRLGKLRERNILMRQFYVIHPERLGMSTYRFLIGDRAFSVGQKSALRAFCERHRRAVTFLTCTGGWDFEIRIETDTAEDVDLFKQELLDQFGSAVGSIRIVQQYKNLHRHSYPG